MLRFRLRTVRHTVHAIASANGNVDSSVAKIDLICVFTLLLSSVRSCARLHMVNAEAGGRQITANCMPRTSTSTKMATMLIYYAYATRVVDRFR